MSVSKQVLALLLLFTAMPCLAQEKVKGSVKDESGTTLPGAVILVKEALTGASKGSGVTDQDGRFEIACAPKDSLTFMFMGYAELTIPVEGRGTIDVVLKPSEAQSLDEAVVIGYGSVRKADVTGSVTSVKMADIKDAPDVSVAQAMQGRVAGAEILSTSGDPAAGTSIRIRGTRSIEASNEPLIVVDDVMDAVSSINDINPAEIESISVLKDASATAIYGARGSNGVILITTKAGNQTKRPVINVIADFGVSALPGKLDVMNASEFAAYRNKYAQNTGNPPSYEDPSSKGTGTDWIGAITRVAPHQNYAISASGGNKQRKFFASVGYLNHQGIIKSSGNSRFNARLNLDNQFFSWLKLGYRMNYTYRRTDQNKAVIGGSNFQAAAVYLSPLMDITENFNPLAFTGGKINNPVSMVNKLEYYTLQDQLVNTLFAEISFTKDLNLKSQLTYYINNNAYYRYEPSDMPIKTAGEGGDAMRRELRTRSLNSTTTLSYDHTWYKRHHLDAVLGFTAYNVTYENFQLSGSGYLDDDILWKNMNAVPDKQTYSANTSESNRTTLSILGRVNYNYRQRYYLTLSGRYDGASNFAANKKWGFFPSAAFKWSIHNEPFMKRFHELDELSLKLSVGRTGNDAVSTYVSQAAMTSTTGGYLFNDAQPVAYYVSRIDSPDLTWEKTDLVNAAVTGSFLNHRIAFELEGYHSRTTDLLQSVPLSRTTGFASRWANLGSTTNTGVEFTLNTRNIVKKNFSWTTDITVSHNRQHVVEIGEESRVAKYKSLGTSPYMMYGYVAGRPLNSLWGFVYDGVWHNQEEIDRNLVTHTHVSQSVTLQPGMPKYVDVDHDGSLSENDLCWLGNADPWLYGGIQNNFRFWKVRVGMYWTYSLGGKIYNFYELAMAGSAITNQFRYMEDTWTPDNPQSNLPGAGIINGAHVPSTLQLHDASYLRLKTLTVSYTYTPKSNKYIRDVRFSISGDNLLLFKKYNGFDPDVSSEGTSSTLRRLDVGAYPKARMVIVGVLLRY